MVNMASGRAFDAQGTNLECSSHELRRTASLPNIGQLSKNLSNCGFDFAKLNGHTEYCEENLTGPIMAKTDITSEQHTNSTLNGKELGTPSLQELKAELGKRGLSKSGKKAVLAERRVSLVDETSRQHLRDNNCVNGPYVRTDVIYLLASQKSDTLKEGIITECPCYNHLNSSIEGLRNEISEIKRSAIPLWSIQTEKGCPKAQGVKYTWNPSPEQNWTHDPLCHPNAGGIKPDEVILHVGTNDLHHEEARTIAEEIVDVANQIMCKNPGTDITISEITTSRDDPSLDSKGKSVNKIVAKFCSQKVPKHTNIMKQEL